MNEYAFQGSESRASVSLDHPVCEKRPHFLQLEQLVETAKSNKDDLAVLLEVCDVVVKGVVDKRSNRKGLETGFKETEKCVSRARDVAKRCGTGVLPES